MSQSLLVYLFVDFVFFDGFRTATPSAFVQADRVPGIELPSLLYFGDDGLASVDQRPARPVDDDVTAVVSAHLEYLLGLLSHLRNSVIHHLLLEMHH